MKDLAHSGASACVPSEREAEGGGYLIASRKHTRKGQRYITFWRAGWSGYAWPLPWAGRYDATEARQISDCPDDPYPGEHSYAVPANVIEPLCVSPRDRDIDGNVGPVLRNTKAHWALIEAHARLLKAIPADPYTLDGYEGRQAVVTKNTPPGEKEP